MAEVTSATPVTAEKGMFPLLEETNGEGVIRGNAQKWFGIVSLG